MKGLVYRIDDGIYLSFIGKDGSPSDGLPISEGVYTTLQDNQISLVNVEIQDGSKNLEVDNIDDFIYNEARQNDENYFYKISDVLLFTFEVSIEQICLEDKFNDTTKSILFEYNKNILKNSENLK